MRTTQDDIRENKQLELFNLKALAGRSNKYIPPTHCPSCKEELITENVFLVCPNKYSCPDQVSGSIIHFCSKDALNIEGLGDETILLLIKKDLIKSARVKPATRLVFSLAKN